MNPICAKMAMLFLFIFSTTARSEYCATHELNCKHLANILLTPKGVEKLLKEQLDVSLINKEAHSKIKSKLQKQASIVLFESKSLNCEKELSPVQITEKMAGSGLEGCSYYPVMEQVGSEIKIVKHVLFRIRLDNFDAKKTKFDVNNVACLTAQSCQAKVSAKQISAVGQLIIETLDGEPLEKPRIELANKSGKSPVSTDFKLTLKPNGEMISALGDFDKLDLQLENTEFKSAVIGTNGKILNKNEVQDLQIAVAQKKREELFQSRFAQGNEAALINEVAKFNQQQKIKGLKEIPLSVFQNAILTQKKNTKYPEIFNQLPSFQGASENAAVGAKGFSAPLTESLFNDQLEIINSTFATNPKVQNMVKAELNKGLDIAEKGVNQMLEQVSGELGRTFIQMHELPVADVTNLIRLNSIEDVIAENNEMLSKSELIPADRKEIQSQNAKLENEAKIISEKLKNAKTLAITTRPFFDRISDMSRIGLFAGGESCPAPTQILKQGVTDKSQLNGAEFGFELSMESLQGYVDEVYKKSQNESVCLGSVDADCKGGKKIKLNKKPQIILTKDGKYRLQMNGIDLGSKIATATIGLSVDLNIGECKTSSNNEKPICMSFGNPSVDEKSTAVKFHDSFSWFVKTSDQQVKEGFAATSEINLSQLLPASVSSSFDVQTPKITGPQGMLVFPMNLRPKDQRLILGKLN